MSKPVLNQRGASRETPFANRPVQAPKEPWSAESDFSPTAPPGPGHLRATFTFDRNRTPFHLHGLVDPQDASRAPVARTRPFASQETPLLHPAKL